MKSFYNFIRKSFSRVRTQTLSNFFSTHKFKNLKFKKIYTLILLPPALYYLTKIKNKLLKDSDYKKLYLSKDEINNSLPSKCELTLDQLYFLLTSNTKEKEVNFISFVTQSEMKTPLQFLLLSEELKTRQIKINLNYYVKDRKKYPQTNSKFCKVKSILDIEDDNEFNQISYILKTKTDVYYFTTDNQNLEIAKKVSMGMSLAKNQIELYNLLNSKKDQTIHLMVPKSSNISFKVIRKFFIENSFMLTDNTLNFIEISDDLKKTFLLKEGEFLIYSKEYEKKNSEFKNQSVIQHSFSIDSDNDQKKEIKIKFVRMEILNPSNLLKNKACQTLGYSEESLKDIIELNFDCGIRENRIKYEIVLDNVFEIFTKFLNYLLDPILDQSNTIYPKILNRKIYVVDSIYSAAFYKKMFYNSMVSFLYINVSKELTNGDDQITNKYSLDDINSEIEKAITELSKDSSLSTKMKDMRIILTSEPSINELFQIIPKEKELITIRFVDYSKRVYYNSKIKNPNAYIIKDITKDLSFIKTLPKNEENCVFTLKYDFNQKLFNKENFRIFIEKSLKNSLKPYLEYYPIDTEYDKVDKIRNLNSINFKQEILNTKGKKIIYVFANGSVGCNKGLSILYNFLHENPNLNSKVYVYNKFNENLLFKKIITVPYIVIYDDDKIIKEINLYKILENENNPKEILIDNLIKSL